MQAQSPRRSILGSSDGQIERMRTSRARIQVLENMNVPNSSGIREAPAVFAIRMRCSISSACPRRSPRKNPAPQRQQPLAENNLAVAY
jgi:hypothetical protein